MDVTFFSPNGQLYGPRRRIHNLSIGLSKKGIKTSVYCKAFYHSTNERKHNNIIKINTEIINGVYVNWVPCISYNSNGIKRLIGEIQFSLLSLFHYFFNKKTYSKIIIADSVTPINGVAGLLAAKLTKAKFIHQIRDIWPDALVYDGSLKKNSLSYKFLKKLELMQYRNADWICSALPNVHSYIKETGGDPKKISYVRNGTELNTSFKKYVPNNDINIVYVGTIAHAHDVISVIKALDIIRKRNIKQKFIFNIYGDGVKRGELQNYISMKKLENIFFKGSIPKDEVIKVLEHGDILVCPVLDSKAYSWGLNLNKLYDYFAAGRPVLISSPLVENDVTIASCGYSCRAERPDLIADALEDFSRLHEERKIEMSLKARVFAEENFDIKKIVDKFETMVRMFI